MHNDLYHIISGTSEDRFDRTDNFEEALRIARSVVVSEDSAAGPVLIEHRGMVIRQLVLLPDGNVQEDVIAEAPPYEKSP
jgi:hypothetical protein